MLGNSGFVPELPGRPNWRTATGVLTPLSVVQIDPAAMGVSPKPQARPQSSTTVSPCALHEARAPAVTPAAPSWGTLARGRAGAQRPPRRPRPPDRPSTSAVYARCAPPRRGTGARVSRLLALAAAPPRPRAGSGARARRTPSRTASPAHAEDRRQRARRREVHLKAMPPEEVCHQVHRASLEHRKKLSQDVSHEAVVGRPRPSRRKLVPERYKRAANSYFLGTSFSTCRGRTSSCARRWLSVERHPRARHCRDPPASTSLEANVLS